MRAIFYNPEAQNEKGFAHTVHGKNETELMKEIVEILRGNVVNLGNGSGVWILYQIVPDSKDTDAIAAELYGKMFPN